MEGKLLGQKIRIRGWIFNSRSSGGILFLLLRDGTGLLQVVADKAKLKKETFELCEKLTQESSVEVEGIVKKDPRAPGGYELSLEDLKVWQIAEPYPLGKKEHGPDFLLRHRHLWIRSQRQLAILKVRHELIKAAEDFLRKEGFLRVDAPLLTPTCCEDTTTLFKVDYFDKKAYLSQSGQLYVEAAIFAYPKVYTFGPSFRAEKSRTRRHLTEFWQIEPEIAFIGLDELMELEERMVSYIVGQIVENAQTELRILKRDVKSLEKSLELPYPRISYDEALDMLRRNGMEIPWGQDLGAQHERVLSLSFEKPVMIHRYPKQVKAFYAQPDPGRPEVVLCDDMLAPEGHGEIIGASVRIWDHGLLEKRVEEMKIPKEAYAWYLNLRKYGSVPHAGFGLGIERTLKWICNLSHIREAIPFPRFRGRLYP